MSIKNIIQQENDLQEMSPRSLANYLNNPTGQYNPYLVAGELQRKEAFAQRQMTEAPQETVVDELVAQAMPMGGMPMGRMPMPQPRPEEVMVSDTITETGIANLPAPNIGQNYAGGGIVGYDNGGEVSGAFDDELELGSAILEMAKEPDIVAEVGGTALLKQLGVASPYIKGMGLGALFYSPELGAAEKYTPDQLRELEAQNQQNFQKGGRVRFGEKVIDYGKKKVEKIKDVYNKFKKKKSTTPTKPKVTKPKVTKPKSKPGAVDRAILGGVGKAVDLGTTGIAYPLAGAVRNPMTGIGALGLGAYLKNQYDESQEEAARLKEEKTRQTLADQAKREADKKARAAQVQAELDADKAARDRQREKEAYLALALGGAKTMAGQSPFALANIGEGLGAGVGALAAYDQNEMERMAASEAATAKAQQDMRIALMDYEMKYYERVNKLADNEIYNARLKQIEDNEEGLVDEDVAKLKEALLIEFAGLDPQSYIANINGQQFTAAE